jgi:hypothetical protein
LIGFGFYINGTNTECYFIFSDGTRSDVKTTTSLDKFTELRINPPFSEVKRVRILYKDTRSSNNYSGLFLGIELFDPQGNKLLSAGKQTDSRSSWFEFELEPGERIIGLKSGRRDKQIC